MLTQAFRISLRILFFRAGPEDIPYDNGRGLTAACMVFGVLANAALGAMLAQAAVLTKELGAQPPAYALVLLGVATVLALALFTRLALQARKLDNRYQQTFNALLLTSSLLSLLMILPLALVMPHMAAMVEFSQKVQGHPQAIDPNTPLPFPAWTALVFLAVPWIFLWQFAVTSWIYRRAADTHIAGGILIAALCVLAVLSFKTLFSIFLG